MTNTDSESSGRQFKNIDDYISTLPKNVQDKLEELGDNQRIGFTRRLFFVVGNILHVSRFL